MRVALAIYAVGVVLGLWRTDGSLATKVTLALLWPLGPLAFLITISGLLVAAVVALAAPKGSA